VPQGPSAQQQSAIRGLPVEMTVKQRSTTAVPGSDESLRITVDDITAGQVMVSLADEDGKTVLAATSLKERETVEFDFMRGEYQLLVRELDNDLIGDDFVTVVISQGLTPSPALPPRGRESKSRSESARGRESEAVRGATPSPTLSPRGRELTDQEKIERLLEAIESAEGDVFIRNGGEHSAKDAAEHLRTKWQAAGSENKSVDDFIDKIASKSSLSGEPYHVRLADGKDVLASDYLKSKLSEIEKNGVPSEK
jgi:hypothetical protein